MRLAWYRIDSTILAVLFLQDFFINKPDSFFFSLMYLPKAYINKKKARAFFLAAFYNSTKDHLSTFVIHESCSKYFKGLFTFIKSDLAYKKAKPLNSFNIFVSYNQCAYSDIALASLGHCILVLKKRASLCLSGYFFSCQKFTGGLYFRNHINSDLVTTTFIFRIQPFV